MKKTSLFLLLSFLSFSLQAAEQSSSLDLQLPSYQPKAQSSKATLSSPSKTNPAQRTTPLSIPLTIPKNEGTSVEVSSENCQGSGDSGNCGGVSLNKSFNKPSVSIGLEGGYTH